MRILIPLNGSKFSEEILEPAAELAARSGAEVHLLGVVKASDAHSTWIKHPSPDDYRVYGQGKRHLTVNEVGLFAETKGQAIERLHSEMEDYLRGVKSRFFPSGAHMVVIIAEDPADEIEAYVRRVGADLIAMATHGRTGLSALLMGNLAAELLRSRVAPMLMFRPDGLEADKVNYGVLSDSHSGTSIGKERSVRLMTRNLV